MRSQVTDARHLVPGIERADSLAFDLHEWMDMPYEIRCLLVCDEQARRQAFSLTPTSLAELIEAASELELAAPVPLNIVCFRSVDTRLDDAVLD